MNYRQPLWPAGEEPAPAILTAIGMADIVKFSREELDAVFGEGAELSAELVAEGVQLLLISDGSEPLLAHCPGRTFTVQPPSVQAKDTTAAGDSFVAGLLYRISGQVNGNTGFSQWLEQPGNPEAALAFAARCGAFAAMHYGAFDALPTPQQLQHLVPEIS